VAGPATGGASAPFTGAGRELRRARPEVVRRTIHPLREPHHVDHTKPLAGAKVDLVAQVDRLRVGRFAHVGAVLEMRWPRRGLRRLLTAVLFLYEQDHCSSTRRRSAVARFGGGRGGVGCYVWGAAVKGLHGACTPGRPRPRRQVARLGNPTRRPNRDFGSRRRRPRLPPSLGTSRTAGSQEEWGTTSPRLLHINHALNANPPPAQGSFRNTGPGQCSTTRASGPREGAVDTRRGRRPRLSTGARLLAGTTLRRLGRGLARGSSSR
jgi:hypothetical protein